MAEDDLKLRIDKIFEDAIIVSRLRLVALDAAVNKELVEKPK